MIGFFDSGLGGLTILKEVVKILPEYSYIYLGDNARTPYGSRSQEIIYKFTVEGVEELFRRDAELVVLACNTSSSAALRKIQREFLQKHYSEKRVLGIIIPTAEEIGRFTNTREIGVLATEATVNSLTYQKEINKFFPEIKVYQQACPLLVPIIEAGEIEQKNLDLAIEKYLNQLFSKSRKIDTIILGCTHYAIIEDKIKKYLSLGIKVISQGPIIAEKLRNYLARHPEIENKLSKTGKRIFLTTEDSERVKNLSQIFYGEQIAITIINIGP
ncbi:MAG: glutamate racemase [bacterium]|nr:glutamate racemase [bacterium]